jgi:translation initiation factor RLI1
MVDFKKQKPFTLRLRSEFGTKQPNLKQPNLKQSNIKTIKQFKMITSKENLETRFKELLTEKTEVLKKMQYLKVVELRDKVNEVLLQLEKVTSVDYIKIVHGYKKTEKGYYPYFES